MATAEAVKVTTQVYRVYIKASAQSVWDAITKPEWTERFGYGGRADTRLATRRSVSRSLEPRDVRRRRAAGRCRR